MKTLYLALSASLLLAACGKKESAPATATTPQQQTAAANTENSRTYFSLPGASGGKVDLASYSGKPVMVFFFSESCPYCRQAGPFVEKIYSKYGPKGLNVVGICVEDTPEAALGFAKATGVTFPLAYGGARTSALYRTRGVPYIFLLDKNHDFYDVWEGYDPEADQSIVSGVENLLAGKKRS